MKQVKKVLPILGVFLFLGLWHLFYVLLPPLVTEDGTKTFVSLTLAFIAVFSTVVLVGYPD